MRSTVPAHRTTSDCYGSTAHVQFLICPLRVSSCTVTLRTVSQIQEAIRLDERLDEQNDDYLADFIKTLTQDDIRWLWSTVLKKNRTLQFESVRSVLRSAVKNCHDL
jgi:hypothetical protein